MESETHRGIQKLVEGNLDLASIVARQVARELGLSLQRLEDLESAGREGLFNAAQRFDASRGVTFRRYASYRIRGTIIDSLRRESTLPRRTREKLQNLEAVADLNETADAPPSSPQEADRRLAEHLARLATALAVGLVSEHAYDEGDAVAVDSSMDAEEELAQEQLRQAIQSAVDSLPEQERTLIRGHYYEGRRFDEISAELGLSKSWGSRLHSRAVGRLTEQLQRYK